MCIMMKKKMPFINTVSYSRKTKAHPRNFQEIDAKYAIHILKVSLVKIIS